MGRSVQDDVHRVCPAVRHPTGVESGLEVAALEVVGDQVCGQRREEHAVPVVACGEHDVVDTGRSYQRQVVRCTGAITGDRLDELGSVECRDQFPRRLEQPCHPAGGRDGWGVVLLGCRADDDLTRRAWHDVDRLPAHPAPDGLPRERIGPKAHDLSADAAHEVAERFRQSRTRGKDRHVVRLTRLRDRGDP